MNITIRKFRPNDTQPFYDAVIESVEQISPWLSWCTTDYSLKRVEDWVRFAQKNWDSNKEYCFIIENADTDKILGSVAINQLTPEHHIGNLGYWVRTSAQNQGVATKASRLAIHYAFEELSLKRIEVHVLKDNHASNAVAKNLGGVFEGCFRNKLLNQGQSLAANCYSIIPEDYKIKSS